MFDEMFIFGVYSMFVAIAFIFSFCILPQYQLLCCKPYTLILYWKDVVEYFTRMLGDGNME